MTVLQFKTGNSVKFRQKSVFLPQWWFFIISSVSFRQKGNPLESSHYEYVGQ